MQALSVRYFPDPASGQKVICISGEEAARVFYDPELFIRKGAIPKRIQKTLTGENAIHIKDNGTHRQRKEAFIPLLSEESIQKLTGLVEEYWQAYLRKWEREKKVVLFEQVQEILCRAACRWAGVPLREDEAEKRAQDFGAMVDAFGGVGPRHWRGKRARKRTEQWIGKIITDIRRVKLPVEKGSPAYLMAWHHDLDGKLLDTNMAAIELMHMIRPTVAIAWYITFSALALHQYPQYRIKLQETDNEEYIHWFVQEVRRYYPFAPFMGARVRQEFQWRGHSFHKGTMLFLDIYGTTHDSRLWKKPYDFIPERFKDWQDGKFDLIPQGGGEYTTGHRCPGERITIGVIEKALSLLTRSMQYEVPEQDLSFSLSQMLTLPKSHFLITKVRAKQATNAAYLKEREAVAL